MSKLNSNIYDVRRFSRCSKLGVDTIILYALLTCVGSFGLARNYLYNFYEGGRKLSRGVFGRALS